MTTFEEDFPELAKELVYIKEILTLCCLSKKRVREAIDKVIPIDEQDAQSVILNAELKKELGLD